MKFIKLYLTIFILITSVVKADSNKNLVNELRNGGKLIFIRHAFAPGGGDPVNFDINHCNTQRNLGNSGKEQAKNIGNFFSKNKFIYRKNKRINLSSK